MSQVTTIEYNGLKLGEVDSGYGISEIKGFGAPSISTSEQQKTEAYGSNIFAQKYNSRVMTFDVEVMGITVDEYLNKAREFIKKYRIGIDDFLIITLWNGDLRKIKAKVTDGPDAVYTAENISMNKFQLELTAENPLFLDNTTQEYSAGLPVTGGFPIPAPVPFPLGSTTGGTFSIINSGDVSGFATFRIYGPVVNPNIRNVANGGEFRINTTISAGDYVDIYRDQQGVFVYLNGVSNYRRFLIGDLFEIEVGSNLIRWNASGFDADALLEATFNNPYLSP